MPKPAPADRVRPRPAAPALSHQALVALFRALADPHRLRILALLADRGEQSVTAIGEELGQSQPAVSHHLRELKTAKLIDFRRDGKFNYYRLDEAGIAAVLDEVSPGGPVRLAVGGVEIAVRKRNRLTTEAQRTPRRQHDRD